MHSLHRFFNCTTMQPVRQLCKFLLILGASQLVLTSSNLLNRHTNDAERTFSVDYANDQFLMDGKDFRYVSGSLHYFRLPNEYWRDRLRKMRAGGLNAVSTYVEWSRHNPEIDQYNWEGDADLEKFIQIAQEEDLYVILRPGPYICAERDYGGFPYWLEANYPSVKPRTWNPDYLARVQLWYSVLMPKMTPYLYGNGGPIIMVQVENEYGTFGCDRQYKEWLRDVTFNYTLDKAVLFTTDTPFDIACGKIDNVYATVDFGVGKPVIWSWNRMRLVEPRGPLVNSEFYIGWYTFWGDKNQRLGTDLVVKHLTEMLTTNASMNFYMFFGGTNFGFTNGANANKVGGDYFSQLTSYDYDAPLTEAGDPTDKYFAIRDAISEFIPLPNLTKPVVSPKADYGTVTMSPLFSILTSNPLAQNTVNDTNPMTFDGLKQKGGFVLYETTLPIIKGDVLTVKNIRDRATVYVDGILIGVVARNTPSQIFIISKNNSKLQLFVENKGRINFGLVMKEDKGLTGTVTWGDIILTNWTSTGYPLDNVPWCNLTATMEVTQQTKGVLTGGPILYQGKFTINEGSSLLDTYLDPTGWDKGVAWVNGRPLGRYWPTVGPQVTLYVPGVYLKTGDNILTLLEQETSPVDLKIKFTTIPMLDKNPPERNLEFG